VRRAEGRVRINAQLIDAETGRHVWAERYDRDMVDIFALQDDISHSIVTALQLTLSDTDRQRLDRPDTTNVEAQEAFMRGMSYFLSYTRDGGMSAREWLKRAVTFDPDYARAYAWLSFVDFIAWEFQWSGAEDLLERAVAQAARAIELDPELAVGHATYGWASLWQGHNDRAIASLERAVALEPNDANAKAMLAESLNFVGQPERAPDLMRAAMRLNPKTPFYPFMLGHAYFLMREYDKSVEAIKDTLARTPDFLPGHRMLAVVYAEMDRMDEARVALAQVRRISPDISATLGTERFPYKNPASLRRFLDGLRKAGLDIPEEPAPAD